MNITIDALRNYVEKIARTVIKDESTKTMTSGTIKTSLPGVYEVQLVEGDESSLVTATSLYSEKTFEVDDYVYLIQAESNRGEDYDTKYFIVGLVTAVQQNFANLSEWERFLGDGEKDGKDILDEEWTVSDLFLNAVNLSGVFSFVASCYSNVPNKTNFGIKFSFSFKDGSTQEIIFDQDSFVGQPWKMNGIKQKKIIDIGRERGLSSLKISVINPDNGSFKVENIEIECGTFLNVVEDFSVSIGLNSPRSYFKNNDDEGTIQIKANVSYGNQKLDTTALKYYWFIEDEDIKLGSEGYNTLAGEGWKCLNSFKYAQLVLESGTIIEDPRYAIYDNKNNYYDFTAKQITKYNVKVKCIATYQLIQVESKPIDLYNFAYEDIDVSITKEGPDTLLFVEETNILQAKLDYKKATVPTGIIYRWYKDGNDNPLEYSITNKNDKGEDETVPKPYSDNKLTVSGDKKKKGSKDIYILENNIENIYCKIFSSDSSVDFGFSNKIAVESKISLNVKTGEGSFYHYWILNTSHEHFEAREQQVEGNTPYRYYVTESDKKEGAFVKTEEELKSNDIFNEQEDGIYYVYYSEQKNIVNTNSDEDDLEVLRYGNYSFPKVLKYVNIENKQVINLLSETEIDQLNTFNELTNSGREQGIKYDDASYNITGDKAPVEDKLLTAKGYYKKEEVRAYVKAILTDKFEDGKTYYTKDAESGSYIEYNGEFNKDTIYYTLEAVDTIYSLRPQDQDNYQLDENNKIIGFLEKEEYYEQSGGDLYINASYIRTGHLEITNGEDKIFSADLENKTVEIGGFHVKDGHLASGVADGDHLVMMSPGWSFNPYGKDYAFWAGAAAPENIKEIKYKKATVYNPDMIYYRWDDTLKMYIEFGFGSTLGGEEAFNKIQNQDTNPNTLYIKTIYEGLDDSTRPFWVKNDGSAQFTNVKIIGEINALSGTIGGFHITENHLANGDIETPTVAEHTVMISGNGVEGSEGNPFQPGEFIFWAGSGKTGEDKPFWIKKDGSIKAESGNIGGWEIQKQSLFSTETEENENIIKLDSQKGIQCIGTGYNYQSNLYQGGFQTLLSKDRSYIYDVSLYVAGSTMPSKKSSGTGIIPHGIIIKNNRDEIYPGHGANMNLIAGEMLTVYATPQGTGGGKIYTNLLLLPSALPKSSITPDSTKILFSIAGADIYYQSTGSKNHCIYEFREDGIYWSFGNNYKPQKISSVTPSYTYGEGEIFIYNDRWVDFIIDYPFPKKPTIVAQAYCDGVECNPILDINIDEDNSFETNITVRLPNWTEEYSRWIKISWFAFW